MINTLEAASYIYYRYYNEHRSKISEMKLHKLLYFAQRESLIRNGQPMFDGVFHGWKYGPVLREIRDVYKNSCFVNNISPKKIEEIKPVMDYIFKEYANKDSWSLSRLTHGEYSWKKSREGIGENENSDNLIRLADIKVDAKRVKERRALLAQLGIK